LIISALPAKSWCVNARNISFRLCPGTIAVYPKVIQIPSLGQELITFPPIIGIIVAAKPMPQAVSTENVNLCGQIAYHAEFPPLSWTFLDFLLRPFQRNEIKEPQIVTVVFTSLAVTAVYDHGFFI
jgi:hypothetical protein